MESLSLPDRLALRLLEALLPSNPWEESTPPRCERHAAPSEAAERFEQLRSLVRAVTPTKPNSVTTVTVPVTCGPAVRRSSFRLPGASAAPAMDRGQMGPQAPGARGLAAEALAAGARERELSAIALWRVPGLKADDSAVRALFRDSLRVPAFVAAGIISCAASVSESDEACRHQAVQLAEEAWFQASGLPHSPEARERAYAAVTMLLRLLSPVRLGDELCIRAGIDPSLVLAAFDDDAARRIVSGLSLDAAAAAGSMLSDPDVADPYSFASMILPAAATTVRAVATARLADALGCGMAEAHVTVSSSRHLCGDKPRSADRAPARLSIDVATSPVVDGGSSGASSGHAPSTSRSRSGQLTASLSGPAGPFLSPRSAAAHGSNAASGSLSPTSTALFHGDGASVGSGRKRPGRSARSSLARSGAATLGDSSHTSGMGGRGHRDGAVPPAAEGVAPGGLDGPQPSDTVAAVAASARRSGEIILGMVERAVARWPFRRRVSLLQLLRVVTPELCEAGSRRLPRARCVHQALLDIGTRSVEASLRRGGAVQSLAEGPTRASPARRAPGITPWGVSELCRLVLPGLADRGTAAAASLQRALSEAASAVASRPPAQVGALRGALGGLGTLLRRAAFSPVRPAASGRILGPASRAAARLPADRRIPLAGYFGIVDALAERHPDLASIAGSVSARRRYCDFVLGGVASALGGDFERGLAVRELQASNLGVALQACATGHLSRVQPFAVELFTPVQQRFLAASQHGVVGRADDSRDGVAAGAAADARGGRAAAGGGGGGGAASAAAAAATAGAGSDPEQVGGALLQEAIPPALRRAAIACLLDTQTFPLRARDGRPLVDPALARMLGEVEDLLCVPAREGRVTAWQLLCAIDAPVPRIIRMAVRALCGEVWFRERFRGAPFEQILAATKEEDHSPAASSSATTKVRTPPPQGAAGGGGTPRAGGITPPATAGGFGLAASPRGGGADSGSGSGSGTRSSAEGFADDDDDALSVASASDAAIAARNAAQAPVAFSFRATSLLALRLVNGAVRELGSGVPGLLTFADWVNLECANGYLGQLALDWLWCGALAGHAGASFIDRAAVRAAAEERVWDALRLQSPPQAPANVVAEGSAARIVDAAFGWNDGGAELDTVERHVSPDAESVEYLASPMASGSIEHVGGRTMAVRGHRALVTMRGVQRGLGAVPAHSVFMDGFISPVTKKEAGGSTVTSKQLRRLVSNGVLLTQTSDRTALLTPSSDRTDRSSGDRVMPLRAEARREWLRLHAAARQDVQRILVSVGDLFRPRALVAAEAGDGAVDIVVNTANRAWPSGGVLPLLVDRVQQGMASD
ncbi:hypothetical protein FNF29_02308 [Cafeteria roenbergensis]|uniref:Uncharacterized protein n=2 Tax=Cafeteria roenbergensis TaxID=33653 RepID=A0A5A8CPX8_CAFRO|nr:hypothetical protein FNF29_02308 [Cafeteria roenbergensis]|eukprot:KAA0154779.1 hypothetical protein FNF29_02308 [Cafeteria roenbergensis]